MHVNYKRQQLSMVHALGNAVARMQACGLVDDLVDKLPDDKLPTRVSRGVGITQFVIEWFTTNGGLHVVADGNDWTYTITPTTSEHFDLLDEQRRVVIGDERAAAAVLQMLCQLSV